jgi:hypothetical protein
MDVVPNSYINISANSRVKALNMTTKQNVTYSDNKPGEEMDRPPTIFELHPTVPMELFTTSMARISDEMLHAGSESPL